MIINHLAYTDNFGYVAVGMGTIAISVDGSHWKNLVKTSVGAMGYNYTASSQFDSGEVRVIGNESPFVVITADGTLKIKKVIIQEKLTSISVKNNHIVAAGTSGTLRTLDTRTIIKNCGAISEHPAIILIEHSDGTEVIRVGAEITIYNKRGRLTKSVHVNEDLRSVCMSDDGRFVAVGAGGSIMVASSPSEWNRIRPITGETLNSVAYGNGVFVAVGDFGTICVSSDLLNWNMSERPITEGLSSVCYSQRNREFLAAGTYTFMKSSDGITWNKVERFGI